MHVVFNHKTALSYCCWVLGLTYILNHINDYYCYYQNTDRNKDIIIEMFVYGLNKNWFRYYVGTDYFG